MKWRRGFQWTYVVVSVAWIALILSANRREWTDERFWHLRSEMLPLMTVLLAPPMVGYLIFFFLIPWIVRGFRPVGRR